MLSQGTQEVSERDKKEREWAALIYLAGDNNLSDAGLKDLQEICEAQAAGPGRGPDEAGNGKEKSVYIGVEIDTQGEHTGSIRYEITDEGHRTVIERLGEQDTGDPRSLIRFLHWGFSRFPARKYLAVIWGHGEGFKLRRGVAFDENGGSLDIPAIAQALANVGVGGDGRKHKLEVLGFDACLMCMVEIAGALRAHVEYLVGSQQTEPGDGWPYDKVLQFLKYADSGADMGKKIVNLYIERCRTERIPNVTQSAIDMGHIDQVMQDLGDLGSALITVTGKQLEAVNEARSRSQSFDMADYVDLVDLCWNLKEMDKAAEGPLFKAASSLMKGAGKAVGQDYNGTFGPAVQRAHGLSVWFPTDPLVFLKYRSKYRSLAARPCPRCNQELLMPGGQLCGCGGEYDGNGAGLLKWADFLDEYMKAKEKP